MLGDSDSSALPHSGTTRATKKLRELVRWNSTIALDPSSMKSAVVSPEVAYSSRYSDMFRLGDTFLLNTKRSRRRLETMHPSPLIASARSEIGKRRYDDYDIVKLVKPRAILIRTDGTLWSGQGVTRVSKRRIGLSRVSRILFYASETSDEVGHVHSEEEAEPVDCPSMSQINPTALYLVSLRVSGLQRGIYLYDRHDHTLVKIGNLDSKRLLGAFDPSDRFYPRITEAAFLIVHVAEIPKVARIYGDRGIRYSLIHTGKVVQNVRFLTHLLGWNCIDNIEYFDKEIEDLIGIDGVSAHVVNVNLVGSMK